MPKRKKISEEQIKEITEAWGKTKTKNTYRRLKALLLYAQGEKHKQIAIQTEFAPTYIGELVTRYLTKGLGAVADNNYHTKPRNLNFDEEKALLDKFRKQAEQGQIVETSAIIKAYEEAMGRPMGKSNGQIYTVLKRHGWRMVMPRSKHPNKASDEEITASKKLTQS
ncbi:MAG: hypothetical protein FWE90_09220 [Defluviitaleaceae bacterium]|nr:hypothetical protein [Defluviitaleaceae bacterium]